MSLPSRLPHLRSLISALPPTPLRPATSPHLSTALGEIVNRTFQSPSGSTAAVAASDREDSVERMISSLERISSNQAYRDYPLSTKTTRPSYDPDYYVRIREGVQRSAEGKGRSWWRSFFQIRGRA